MINQVSDLNLKLQGMLIDSNDQREYVDWYIKAIVLENKKQGMKFNWKYVNQGIINKFGLRKFKKIKQKAWSEIKKKEIENKLYKTR